MIDLTNIIPVVFDFWMWIKMIAMLIMVLYFILSLVIVRQVQLVEQLVETGFSSFVKLVTVLHALAVFGLLILSWMLI